jgi:hypothetical protein
MSRKGKVFRGCGAPLGRNSGGMGNWLGDQDSNLDKQIQSLPCYHYTISQQGAAIMRRRRRQAILYCTGNRKQRQAPGGLRHRASGFGLPASELRSPQAHKRLQPIVGPIPPGPASRLAVDVSRKTTSSLRAGFAPNNGPAVTFSTGTEVLLVAGALMQGGPGRGDGRPCMRANPNSG